MPRFAHASLAVLFTLTACPPAVRAQNILLPEVLVPARPLTKPERDRREAMALFGLGQLNQSRDRLLEATKNFEDAARLDPASASIPKALIPLYFALSRIDDALNACRKVLDLDPGDFETWHVYAQQLKAQAKPKEARDALKRAAACHGIGERADLQLQVYFDLGSLAEEAQDYDQAVAAFERVVAILEKPETLLDLGPFNAEQLREQAANTVERMIKICIQAKQFDRALLTFEKAKKKYPALSRRLDYNLAKVCMARGQAETALRHLDQYLLTQPQGTEAYELKINLLNQLHRGGEVVPALQEYVRRDPQNLALELLLARECKQAGDGDKAEKLYSKLANKSPTPELYRAWFHLLREQGRMQEALHLLDTAVTQSTSSRDRADGANGPPDNPRTLAENAAKAQAMVAVLQEDAELVKALLPAARQQLVIPPPFGRGGRRARPATASGGMHTGTRQLLAVMAARTQQLDDAERLYRDLIGDRHVDRRAHLTLYAGLLEVLQQARKYEEYAALCREALKRLPEANRVYFQSCLAHALLELGRGEEALAEAEEVVDRSTAEQRLGARLERADILAHLERFDKAIAECQDLLREYTKPEEVRRTRIMLSNVYSRARDPGRSEEQLELILKEDPNNALANNNLGYAWADRGVKLDEAERLIRKAIDLDRQSKKLSSAAGAAALDNAAYVDSMGWVLFRRGQLEAARDWLEKATALPGGDDDPDVWDHLGDVYYRLDATAKARAAWQKALEFFETRPRRRSNEKYKEVKHKLEMRGSDARQRGSLDP